MKRLRWRERSLRTRLAVMVGLAVAVAVVVTSSAAWLLTRANLYQQFDAQLQTYAQVAAKAATPADALATLHTVQRGDSGADPGHRDVLAVQFLTADGTSAGTAGAPGGFPPGVRARQVAAGAAALGADVEKIGGDRYRVWTVPRPGGGAVSVARNSEGIENTLAELGAWLTLAGLIGIAGAAFAGRAIAKTALRPVAELTDAAEDVARTQELAAGIRVVGSDELARLAVSFNAMLTALRSSRDEQQRLVQDAGHELRTPLTSLRNNIELLIHAEGQERVLPPEDRTRLLADLDVQSVELTTLVGELVELSTGEREPEPVGRVDLADVLASAAERVRARYPDVEFGVDAVSAEVDGRPAALERAVLNVLDNAAKWSPAGGKVTAAVVPAEGGARIVVSDEGPGIAPADLPHVFERFYRAETARAQPGSGLGLAIVEQVVEQHRGAVRAGAADGGGARFELTFPAALA
ncbi:HAMP domain-containing sensor histidine kinase [Amycolatopsis orientalis]|uniref:HAMP domain-containing sensor histidine kinase n=1 Tax=Amycolatopsis orientalis TaxID=31958 RepID=UPI0003A3C90A|nr:HAMP domain-containing sensor histidine kinase [Amycolatopsis orientalis]